MPIVDNSYQRTLIPNYFYQGRLWTVISKYQIRKDIMDSIFTVLREFFERRSKLIAIRIELHLKQWTENNSCVREFFAKLRRQLLKQYGNIYYRYIWVREQDQAKAQHYHAVLLVDGQFVKHPSIIEKIARSIWVYGYFCLPQGPSIISIVIRLGDFVRLSIGSVISPRQKPKETDRKRSETMALMPPGVSIPGTRQPSVQKITP